MTSGTESPAAYFSELFERARRALAEHAPWAEAAQDAPASPAAGPGGVAAQLRIDDRTRDVVVRFYDAQTGATLREVTAQQVAAAAARLRAATI